VTHPSRLVLHLFSYPAWKVDLNDKWLTTESHGSAGQLVIPVPAGENKVRIIFAPTNDRKKRDDAVERGPAGCGTGGVAEKNKN